MAPRTDGHDLTMANEDYLETIYRLSRDAGYSEHTVEYKLLDLFNRAATRIIAERYEAIN